jgi:glycosyltransferase involved in cell wall biosynthesis
MASDSPNSDAQRDAYVLVLPWDPRGDIGGVNQVVCSLYDGIARDGRLVPHAVVSSWDAVTPTRERDPAGRSIIKFRLISPSSREPSILGALRYALRLPGQLRRLRRFVKEQRVAVANCHYIGASDPVWVLAKTLGVFRGKVFLSLHGRDIRTLAETKGLRWHFWRWVLKRADAVVACSVGLAKETTEKFRLSTDHVVTIHNGFDTARLGTPTVGDASPAASWRTAPQLLNLGTFEHKKGHDVLLRAFRRVVDAVPKAHLTIMGRRAETTDSTLRLVDELRLQDNVTIRIDVPHEVALDALRTADLFVLPSRNEAFSIALLEAGAYGKPVVATDVCGVAELIENDRTGVLVPSENVDRLAAGILNMIADPSRAIAYGRELRRRVMTQFSADETCRGYLRLAGVGP